MLTAEQQLYFHTFGFLVRRQVFNPDEMDSIGRDFAAVMERDRQGQDFSGATRHGVIGFVEKQPGLRRLAEDDRIYEAVEDLLEPGFVWIGSDGNLYVGDTSWHSDGSHPYLRIKVALYLDPVERDTGCLRVIPGSHRGTLHDRLREQAPTQDADRSPFGTSGPDVPSFPLESRPGDVVCFNQNLWHSSWGGKAGRRMFTMNFGARPIDEADFTCLRAGHAANVRNFIPNFQFTQDSRVHDPDFLLTDSARIRGMVTYLHEMGLT